MRPVSVGSGGGCAGGLPDELLGELPGEPGRGRTEGDAFDDPDADESDCDPDADGSDCGSGGAPILGTGGLLLGVSATEETTTTNEVAETTSRLKRVYAQT